MLGKDSPGMDFFFFHAAKVSANCFCSFSLGKELQLRAEGLSAARGDAVKFRQRGKFLGVTPERGGGGGGWGQDVAFL